MRLLQVQDIYGKETYINADRVNFVKDSGDGSTTIHFGPDDLVQVRMEVAAVAAALFNAGKP